MSRTGYLLAIRNHVLDAQCRYQPPQPFQLVRPAEVSTRSPKYAFRFAVDGAQVASSANPRSATELATLTQPSIPQHLKADGTYDYADTFPRRVRPPRDESSGNSSHRVTAVRKYGTAGYTQA